MKKISIVLALSCLLACHGNESAESEPTDLDRKKNDDTTVIKTDSANMIKKDSTDTVSKNK